MTDINWPFNRLKHDLCSISSKETLELIFYPQALFFSLCGVGDGGLKVQTSGDNFNQSTEVLTQ